MPLVFPVSLKGSFKPKISDGWHLRSSGNFHYGVDILYPRQGAPVGIPISSTPGFIMYFSTAAVAAHDGVVTMASRIGTGNRVRIKGDGIESAYMHLSSMSVREGQNVRAGDPVGVIGDDPTNPIDPAHLHFELHLAGTRLDPEPHLRDAHYVERSAGIGIIEIALVGGAIWLATRKSG